MYLDTISILNYKNIASADMAFSPRLNCFIGDNGAGKTNILDAVYFLCCCKSRTNPTDRDNIRHDEEFFMLQGNFVRGGVKEQVSAGLKRGRHKSFKRNGKEYPKLQLHIGLLPAVMVSPDDIVLISDGSDERRKFADGVVSQYDARYLDSLLRYNRLLAQRNSMLKDDCRDEELFDVCEMQMGDLAEAIYNGRRHFIENLIPVFQHYYEAICNGREQVGIKYRSHIADGPLASQLQSVRERDRIIGFTTKGTHKDELEMFLDGYPLKKNSSQGQGKSFLIALKLAQYEILKSTAGVKPVLLLDDIFDKLDASRVEKIIKIVSGDNFGQIFITDTNREHVDLLLKDSGTDYSLFKVSEGNVSKMP